MSTIVTIKVTDPGPQADAIISCVTSKSSYALDKVVDTRYEVYIASAAVEHDQGRDVVRKVLAECDPNWHSYVTVL